MSIHGDIRINHKVIGYWQAQCQPGKDGIHPYRWGATLNGVTVRGVLTHAQADGALALTSKVTAAAAIAVSSSGSARGSIAPRVRSAIVFRTAAAGPSPPRLAATWVLGSSPRMTVLGGTRLP